MIKQFTKLLLGLVLLITAGVTKAQVSVYTFASSSGTYAPVTGGTAIKYGNPVTASSVSYATLDDDVYYNRPIGFTFVYNGVSYTDFGFNSNGWLILGNSTTFTSTSTPISSTTASLSNIISAASIDLFGGIQVAGTVVSGNNFITANAASPTTGVNIGDSISGTGIPTPGAVVTAVTGTTVTIDKNTTSGSTTSSWRAKNGEIRYETIGSGSSRTLVLQFSGFARFSATYPGDRMNFQIRLNETTNLVQIIYGTWSTTYTGTAGALQVGLKGASATDYNSRTTTTDWAATTAGTTNAASMRYNSTVLPSSGLTYTWTSASCISPTILSFSAVTTSTATITWNAIAGVSQYEYEVRTSGAAGSGGTGLVTTATVSTNSVNLTGLSSGSNYTFYVRSVCGASNNGAWSAGLGFTTACTAVSAFTENFDGVTAPALPACFAKVGTGGTANTQTTDFSSSPNTLYLFSSTTLSQALVALKPVSNAGAGTHQLRFKLRANFTAGDTLQVGYLTDISNAASFVVLTQIRAASLAYAEYTVSPGTAPGATQYLAFRAKGTSGASMLIDDVSWEPLPSCPTPSGIAVNAITATSASVSFSSVGGSFILEYGATGFTPGTGTVAGTGGTIVTGTSSPIAFTGLTPNTTYQVYVRQNCTAAGNAFSSNSGVVSFTTLPIPPPNDNASGAITLTIGTGCTGASYTNVGSSLGTGEPYPSCSGVANTPVWFKFVAPASGAVRVSTDVGNSPTFTDSKVGLFAATDPANYATFSIISCDEDGGSAIGSGFLSVVYATGLTAGTTYYVAVDKYTSTTTSGTFCITVDEMNTNMLSTTNTCTRPYQTPVNNANTTYTGWVPLLDSSSLLIALVRNPAGGATSSYTVSQNVNTGAVRQSNSTYYLNRNYRISNTTATNVDVQFFFLNTELAALAAADPAVTLVNLGVTRQNNGTSTSCYNNLDLSVGGLTFIPQTGNGTAGGVNWISFNTPAFSNFYLHRAGTALPITLQHLKGIRIGTGNALNWKGNCTSVSITMQLERSSDSRSFKSITSITASQARCNQPFDYTDASPLKGTNYYRLKMIDVDGKVSYSPIVAIINGNSGAELVGIYPTVVRDEAFLSVAASRSTKMQINITDMSGRVIKTISQTVANGSTLLSINTVNLSAGVYNITGMLDGAKTKTLRFVKQ